MREWLVASGIVEGPDGVLLVQNKRRNGDLDWSTPGGVIEVAGGETVLDGLTREVHEETGIEVSRWQGPLYEVEVEAAGLGWRLRVEVHRAEEYAGQLRIADVDGIVVDARFVPSAACGDHLDACPRWVGEPLSTWLEERGGDHRRWRYRVEGTSPADLRVLRL